MPNLNNLINKILSNIKVSDGKTNIEMTSSNNLFTRLHGPFGIDYSTLKAKGTIQ